MILYIEDNAQNMRLVRKMLKVGGHTMIGAEDGTTGIEMAKSERPDLILVDINLPDIDGTEVTKRLKADESFNGVPIIALTANAMYGDRERFLDAGCDDYLSKPVGKQELLDMVAKHLKPADDDAEADEQDKADEKAVAETVSATTKSKQGQSSVSSAKSSSKTTDTTSSADEGKAPKADVAP